MHKTWAGAAFLLVITAVLTFPLWYSRAETSAPAPIVHPSSGECIEPVEVMRKNHMTMLYDWRDSVVRTSAKDRRWYVNSKGVRFEKSLTRTCLGCHESRRTFCDRCHERVSVTVTCFQCHASDHVSYDGGEAGASPEAPHDHE
jgi:hypothetical protein